MAACELDAITVSGAVLEQLNGVYTNIGTDVNGSSVFVKSGSVNYPRVFREYSGPPGRSSWKILVAASSFGHHLTNDSFSTPDCPPEGTMSAYAIGTTGTVTIVHGGSGAPGEDSGTTYGFPPGVVALITARHKTVKNYLRLRNQGQI